MLWALLGINVLLLVLSIFYYKKVEGLLAAYDDRISELRELERKSKTLGEDVETIKDRMMAVLEQKFREKVNSFKEEVRKKMLRLNMALFGIKDLSSALTLEEALDRLVEVLSKTLGLNHGGVFLYLEAEDIFVCAKVWGDVDWIEGRYYSAGSSELIRQVKERGGIFDPKTIAMDPVLAASASQGELAADAVISIRSQDKFLGMVLLKKVKSFSKEDVSLLFTISSVAAIVLENAKTFELTLEELEEAKELSKREREEKQKLKEVFSKYVSPQVVAEIVKNPDSLELGGVKKKIAVLFSDIRGFTSMSEKMQPEEVVAILNEYFEEMTKIVFKYNGTLDKYMGDAIMALYGAPVEMKNPVVNAVATAVEMQKRLKELNEQWANHGWKTLGMGIGITYGDVVVGNIGSSLRMDYTAIGDTVNLASRLQGVAKAGEVLVSDQAYEQIKDYVMAEELEPIKVKGKEKPVRVYKVIALLPEAEELIDS